MMLKKLFGSAGPELREMGAPHLRRVLEIIAETDEDDAAEAEWALTQRAYRGMYVLVHEGEVMGVTGATRAEDVEDVMWLSWTYLTEQARGSGLGNFMLDRLLGQLNEHGTRKLFIATSDYVEDGEDVYADARRFYESFGAAEELRVADYHGTGEAKIIYGLNNPGVTPEPPEPESTVTGVRFHDLHEAPESDHGGALTWTVTGDGVTGIEDMIGEAAKVGLRLLVTSLPQDVSNVASEALTAHGFQQNGVLTDYYGLGVAQVWWSRDLGHG